MAIEAKGFTEKDELIAKFYTLRAGLSAIAEDTKQIRDAEEQLEPLESTHYRQKRQAEDKIEKERDALIKKRYDAESRFQSEQYKIEIENEEISRLSDPQTYKGRLHNTHLDGWWVLVFLFGYLFFGALYGLVLFIGHLIPGLPEVLLDIDVWVIIGLVGTILIGNLFRVFIVKMSIKKDIKKCRKAIDSSQREYERLKKQFDQIDQDVDRQLKELERKSMSPEYPEYFIDLYKNELDEAEAHLNQEIIPLHTARTQAITQALHQQFDAILMEADWENVDLLIFYLSTGRADSLKEALQLVDRQRQTDQISSAIQVAAHHIANTLRENTYRLAGVMTGCFRELSSQIQASQTAILAGTNRTAAALGQISSQMQSLHSGIESQNQILLETKDLNAALLEQADKSSHELMYELRYNQEFWKTN